MTRCVRGGSRGRLCLRRHRLNNLKLTPKEIALLRRGIEEDRDDDLALLRVPVILAQVLELERHRWTCLRCGAHTTVISEMCSGCGREDINQGVAPLVREGVHS